MLENRLQSGAWILFINQTLNNIMYKLYFLYSFFRYDAPRFLKNIWKFKKALYNYYPFHYEGLLYFLEIGINDLANNSEKYGYEILTSRAKKIEKMRRASEILQNYNTDRYLEMAEKELGKNPEHFWKDNRNFWKDNRSTDESNQIIAVYKRAERIEEEDWDELMIILKGQDYSTFDPAKDFYEQFDGSGLKTWWD